MASWDAVTSYLISNYKVELLDHGSLIKLSFSLKDKRFQTVFIQHHSDRDGNPNWLDFLSPIGELGEVNLTAAIKATDQYVAGGISLANDLVMLRVSVPMKNLDQNEIEQPLHLVCGMADDLEQSLTGKDVY